MVFSNLGELGEGDAENQEGHNHTLLRMTSASPSVGHSPYVVFIDNPHQLEVIDQRKLPLQEVKLRLRTVDDVKKAIETMIVRGAPVSRTFAHMYTKLTQFLPYS